MTLPAGTRIGPYEIQSALGAGGMGEVYRARDTKLHRDVALKVLPELHGADPDRLARFRGRRRCWPPSITRTSGRSTVWRTRRARRRWSSSWSRGRPSPSGSPRGALPLDEALAGRAPDRRRARRRPRARHHPSRPQARQRQAAPGRRGQGPGLRPRQGARAGARQRCRRRAVADHHHSRDDADGRDPGNGGLHEPGAGQGPPRRQAQRHLGVRVRALRDADRPPCLRRRGRGRHAGARPDERAAVESPYRRRLRPRSAASSAAAWSGTATAASPTSPTRGSSSTKSPARAPSPAAAAASPTPRAHRAGPLAALVPRGRLSRQHALAGSRNVLFERPTPTLA